MRYLELTQEEWIEKYKPIMCDNRPAMFQPDGENMAFVSESQKKNPYTIWTHTCADDGEDIESGLWKSNVCGYYVTEIPFDKDDSVTVTVDEGVEMP